MSFKPLALFLVMILGFVSLFFLNVTDRKRARALRELPEREN